MAKKLFNFLILSLIACFMWSCASGPKLTQQPYTSNVSADKDVLFKAAIQVLSENGFQIQNTSSTITTMDVPTGEDLIFAEAGTEVGRYDGDNDNWIFNPANDVQLSPILDVDLTPQRNIIMNPAGDIRVFDDLDMDGVNTIDMGTSASSGSNIPTVADGYFQIKLNGVTKFVAFFNTLP